MLGKNKESGKATSCTRAFSAVIVAAMVMVGFVGITQSAEARINEDYMPDDQYDGTLLETINSNLPDTYWAFSFMQISDLHIGEGYADYGTAGYDDSPPAGDVGYAAERLRTAVNWINNNKNTYKIKFVMVVGDITDSAEKSEFYKAKEILDTLTIPYVPCIGNHDIWPYTANAESYYPVGDRYFREVFGPQLDKLRTQLPRWDDGTRNTAIWNGEADSLGGSNTGIYSYFQNFAFDYAGHHFICTDFNTRDHAPFGYKGSYGEPDLFDSSLVRGTWPWLKNHLNSYPYKASDNIFIFSHHPLTQLPTAGIFDFTSSEYETITEFLDDYYLSIGLWSAGHLHFNRIYNIKDWDGWWYTTICPGHETAALKEAPVAGPGENGGTVVHRQFNAKIFRIWAKTSIPEPYGVILYEHINYGGRGELFTRPDPDLRNNIVGNDKASSHRMYKPYTYVWLYEHINYGGRYKFFSSDVSDYRSYGINDWVSSLKVY